MSGLVLVIEDEVDLATTLEYNLRSEGFQVRLAHSGRQGLAAATSDPTPDVIVLDLMLPDLAGTEICRRLREQDRTRETPVIMCTAKGEEIDRVVGFEVGADDYLVKPFSVRELILRMNARLKPRGGDASPRVPASVASNGGGPRRERRRFILGPLEVDPEGYHVFVEGKEVHVSALEMRLLIHLFQSQGCVRSRKDLL